MPRTKDLPLKALALSHPGAARILEAYHLDYCCGGEETLSAACRTAGLDPEEVQAALELVQATPAAVPSMQERSLAELVDYIVKTHHDFTRSELTRIQALLQRVVKRHGANHRELEELERCFEQMTADLLPHLTKEEAILFPYIAALEDHVLNGAPLYEPCFATVDAPIRVMTEEHQIVGDLLKQARKLTQDYDPPTDACATYRALYQALESLEVDLMRHIHLENNVVFPRAKALAGTS